MFCTVFRLCESVDFLPNTVTVKVDFLFFHSHLKNPEIQRKITKLYEAGILQIRWINQSNVPAVKLTDETATNCYSTKTTSSSLVVVRFGHESSYRTSAARLSEDFRKVPLVHESATQLVVNCDLDYQLRKLFHKFSVSYKYWFSKALVLLFHQASSFFLCVLPSSYTQNRELGSFIDCIANWRISFLISYASSFPWLEGRISEHGSYNLEKVLNFSSRLEKSWKSPWNSLPCPCSTQFSVKWDFLQRKIWLSWM